MKKYEVTIQFVWQAKNRTQVWLEVGDYLTRKMRNLANIRAVSTNSIGDDDWIALNEPIKEAR